MTSSILALDLTPKETSQLKWTNGTAIKQPDSMNDTEWAFFNRKLASPTGVEVREIVTEKASGRRIFTTGNESVWVKSATIDRNNRLRIETNSLADRTIDVCGWDRRRGTFEDGELYSWGFVCEEQIVPIPNTLSVRENKEEDVKETISRDVLSSSYTLQLRDDVTNYKIGDNSIHLVNDIVSSGDTTGLICEGGYCRLNITDNSPYNKLIAYWGMDMDNSSMAWDYSENDNDLTYEGGGFTNDSCIFNSCFEGDGAQDGDKSRIESSDFFPQMDGLENFSVSLWIRPKAIPSGLAGIFTRGGTSTFAPWIYAQDSDINILMSTQTSTDCFLLGTLSMTKDKWQHLVLTKNRTHCQIWSDGVGGTVDGLASPNIRTADNKLLIGDMAGSFFPFNGSIDEVMIFNKSLTATEVSDIFNNQSQRFIDSGTLGIGQELINLTSANAESEVNISNTAIINGFDSNVTLTPWFNGIVSSTPKNTTSEVVANYTTAGFGNMTLNYTLYPSQDNFYTPLLNGSALIIYSEMGGGNVTTCRDLDVASSRYTVLNDITFAGGTCFEYKANNILLDVDNHLIYDTGSGTAVRSASRTNTSLWNGRFESSAITLYWTALSGGLTKNNYVNDSQYGWAGVGGTGMTQLNETYSAISTVADYLISLTEMKMFNATVYGLGSGNGLYISGGNDNTLDSGNFSTVASGFLIVNADDNTISNVVSYNNTSNGILFEGGSNNIFNNLELNRNGQHGLSMVSGVSVDNEFTNVTTIDNGNTGIRLDDDIVSTEITDFISKDNARGVYISIISDDNLFINGNISNHTAGDVIISDTSTGNTFLNVTYGDEALVSTADLTRQWYAYAYVNNTLGRTINNANVTAINVSGATHFSELTDSNGNIAEQILTEYFNDSFLGTIYFTPYSFNVSASRHQNLTNISSLTLSKLFPFTLTPYPTTCGKFANDVTPKENLILPVVLSTDGLNRIVKDDATPYTKLCFGTRFI